MKLIDIYKLAIRKGIEKDPRTRREINEELTRARKEFRKSKGADRRAFDKERLTNPYADTRILYGDLDADIRAIIVGIDMEGPEILTAARLNEREPDQIDLVMAHHPEGVAWARFYDVMHLQEACLRKLGIPAEVAQRLLKERIEEVGRAVAPANHTRSVDIARLLDIPYMCIHTPADNHVASYLQRIFDRKKPKKLSQVVSILKAIPEYADGLRKNAGPRILIGEPNKDAGKVFVDMTGGTEGSKKVFGRLSQAGVGTIVAMHLGEDHFKRAKDEGMNVVIAGHIASDTLGLNLLLDGIEKVEKLNVVACSGFIRVRR
ncbi:MAG: NGG1p interacting factor NIF3 [Candidatus Omnitrophica bacterium]|nr:NGG1p interacting factor NIF3 [Candidatus Omnitrophota bacterium]